MKLALNIFAHGLLAVLSLSAYGADKSSAKKALTVQTFTASEPGFLVNSHLILGSKDAILVDAQFTRSEAKKVAALVKESGHNLTTIFVTHGHPDHYFGLEVLKAEFPSAKLLTSPGSLADMQATAKGKQEYWKGIYKEDLLDQVVFPEAFSGEELDLEGQKIKILPLKEGESSHASVLYIPSTKALFTGDAVYSGVHLWLAEQHVDGWIKTLDELGKLNIATVYPGHGPVGNKDLLKANTAYIKAFQNAVKNSKTKADAVAKLTKLYPDAKLPIILDISVGSFLK